MLAVGEEFWNSLESFTIGRIKQWLLLASMSGSITLVVFISLPREFHQDVINSVDLKKKHFSNTICKLKQSFLKEKRPHSMQCDLINILLFLSQKIS